MAESLITDLDETLLREKPTILDFLLSDEGTVCPDIELDLERCRDTDGHRDVKF